MGQQLTCVLTWPAYSTGAILQGVLHSKNMCHYLNFAMIALTSLINGQNF